MPTYGYRCSTCGTEFERFQKMSDPPVTDCECGAKGSVKKLIFPVGIQFKGSGFYINDYTKAGKAEANESKSDSAGKTDSATPAASGKESGESKAASSTDSGSSAASQPATGSTTASSSTTGSATASSPSTTPTNK